MNVNDPFLLQRADAAELFLIRHGDAIPGPDEIIPSGIYDNLPLSRMGREQARLLAERLKDTRFDAAYSSPLRRCQETAAPLLEYLHVTPTIVENIKEVRLGSSFPLPEVKEGDNLDVLTKALHQRQLEITRKAAITGSWDAVKDSEPSKEFRQRVVNAMDGIARENFGKRVLVFAHGGVINAYAAETLGLQADFFFPCANTSITIIRASTNHRVLYVLNDVGHLKLTEKS